MTDDRKRNPMDDTTTETDDQQKGGEATATDQPFGDIEDMDLGEDTTDQQTTSDDTSTEDTSTDVGDEK